MPIRVYYEVLNQKGTPALYSDNYAQRPAAGYQGRIFYSPDTAQIFYDTGSTWTLLADAGVGSGSLASVCANGNTTATGITITAGGLSTNSFTNTSFTQGWIMYAGAGGTMLGNNNLYYDAATFRLGLGTNAPGVTLDIHGTGGTLVQLNGTGTNNSYLQFQNAGTGKWRIGNQYQGGTNSFGIYNNTLAANALTIDSTSNATFVANVTASSFTSSNGIGLAVSGGGGFTSIFGLGNGISISLPTTITQQLIFPTGVGYTYTYPQATGTILNSTSFTTNAYPKFTSTNGVVTTSMLSDDGTSVTSAGATRSNLYIKAANNTYYGQLAFTNGSNSSYGGLSYNNAGQYMQFETSSSEWMRLLSNGYLGINRTSIEFTLDVNGDIAIGRTNKIQFTGPTAGDRSRSYIQGDTSNNIAVYGPYSNNLIIFFGASSQVGIGTSTPSNQFHVYNANYQNANGLAIIQNQGTASGSNGLFIDTYSANVNDYSLYIRTNNGNTSALTVSCKSNVAINVGIDASLQLYIKSQSATSSSYNIYSQNSSGTTIFYVRSDGYGYLGDTVWHYGSDIRLKENILDVTEGLSIINKLQPKFFDYINGGKNRTGFIAQEVQEILPNAVSLDERTNYLTLATDTIIPYLVKGVQQIDTRLTNVEEALLTLQQNLN